MDQEFRWYSMFERLNQSFMNIRISLSRQPGRGRPYPSRTRRRAVMTPRSKNMG